MLLLLRQSSNLWDKSKLINKTALRSRFCYSYTLYLWGSLGKIRISNDLWGHINGEVLAVTKIYSVIHNNEVCDEIVKWGNANGYPLQKAKLYNKLKAYVGFSPEGYMIKAEKLPPIPGGWQVTVEK